MASANNALIGALRVEATLDAGKFVTGAAKIRKESKQTEATVKSSFSGMGAAMKAGIAGFVGSLSVGYFASIAKAALDYAGSLGEVAQQLGVTTKDLQTFRYMAGQVGVSQEQLETGLSKLTITLGKVAAGAKEPTKALNAIGISAKQVANVDTGTAFRMIADGLQKVDDRAQRAAVEVALFGKTGSKLDNMLSGGSKRINELSAAAEKLGIVLSDEQIQRADDTADKLEALKTVLAAQIAGVVADNADAIYKLADSIAHLVSQIPNALAAMKAFYANFLRVRADITEGIDQAIEHPLNRFNPLVAPFRGGRMHANRVRNVQADRLDAQEADWQAFLQRSGAVGIRGRRTPSGSTGSIDQFLAPGGSKKKGPTDRSDDVLAQYAREQMQADAEILRARQQLATSSAVRAGIELELIELERQMHEAEIDEQVRRAQKDAADGQITKAALREVEAQAVILKEKNDKAARLRAQAVIDERTRQVEEDTFEAAKQQREFAIENLRFADQMARTQEEHRRIQLQILDAEIEQKRLELEHQKQLAIRNGATQQEIDAIQARIERLGVERAQGAAGIIRNTQGPLEDYFSQVPRNAAEAQEAMERLQVMGIDGAINSLITLTEGFDSFRDTALSAIKAVIAEFIRMQSMKLAMNLFGATTGAPGLGSVGGSAASGITVFNSGGSFFTPGFASGGSMILGGRPGIDKNLLSLNGLPIARVSYGERATFSNDNQRGGRMGGGITVHAPITIQGNADRRTIDQAASTLRRRIARVAQYGME